jgi:hypothetical protein
MGQPVKISDELLTDARAIAEKSQRSIAGQVEYWAQLGRALEPVLRGDRALALRESGRQRSLAEAVAAVDTDQGRQRVREYLAKQPFPHFEPVSGETGLYRKIEADGTESIGRFVSQQFQAVDQQSGV